MAYFIYSYSKFGQDDTFVDSAFTRDQVLRSLERHGLRTRNDGRLPALPRFGSTLHIQRPIMELEIGLKSYRITHKNA